MEERNDYATGSFKIEYSKKIKENLLFSQILTYDTNIFDTSIAFVDSHSSLEVKFAKNLSLGVSYKVNYQKTPPAPGIKKVDTTFTTNLIIDFVREGKG